MTKRVRAIRTVRDMERTVGLKQRKLPKKEVWTKKCSARITCGKEGVFIPDDYEVCDYCLLAKFDLHPKACSFGNYVDHAFEQDDVLRALRQALGETYVKF